MSADEDDLLLIALPPAWPLLVVVAETLERCKGAHIAFIRDVP